MNEPDDEYPDDGLDNVAGAGSGAADDALPPECARVDPDLAELALGALAGKERVTALAHLEDCSRCSAEVDELAAAADQLLHLAPAAEPPVGFEARVFERLGLRPAPAGWRSWSIWRPKLALAVAAAAVVVAFGLGTLLGYGTGVAGRSTTPTSPHTRRRPVRRGTPRRSGHGLCRQPHMAFHVHGRRQLEGDTALRGGPGPGPSRPAGPVLAVGGQRSVGGQRGSARWAPEPGPHSRRCWQRPGVSQPHLTGLT